MADSAAGSRKPSKPPGALVDGFLVGVLAEPEMIRANRSVASERDFIGLLDRRVFRVAQPGDLELRLHQERIWPEPTISYFDDVSSASAKGPRQWSFCVLMPISAPKPNSAPSVKRVEAFQ